MAYSAVSETNLASPEELESIKTLREQLAPELKALADAGKDFTHTTGDIFFTRLLRGNNGNLEEAVAWYRKFIELRNKFGLDDIHAECEKNNIAWKVDAMPFAEDMKKYSTSAFDQDTLRSPAGNLLWYDSYGDMRVPALLSEMGEEKIVRYQHFIFERRTSAIDKVSRDEGKIVKIVRIMDFEGMSLSNWTREFQKLDDASLTPVLMGTSIESVHIIFMINFPRLFYKIWEVLKSFLPPRLVARFRVLDANYMQDKELLAEVGLPMIRQLVAMKKNTAQVEDVAMEGKGKPIPAGSVFERVVEVSAGQKVKWDYKMGKGDDVASSGGYFTRLASKFSGSEVVFSVDAIWTDNVEGKRVPAKVRSAGKANGDTAEFWVDGKPIDYTASTGVNVIAVDTQTLAVISSKCYDTESSTDSACKALIEDIASLPRYCLVLVGVKGTGAEELSPEAWEALGSCGAVKKEGHWHKGYALVGTRGGHCISETRDGDAVAEGDVPIVETDCQLVEPKEVSMESGDQSGSADVDREGMVMVRWSNLHSSVAQKALAEFKVAVE